MREVTIKADVSQIERLGRQFDMGAEIGLRRVVERGEQIVRREVPKVTNNLMQGISSEVDGPALKATITISARSGRRGARKGTLHLPGGKTKQISLRPQPAFDYAEAVATGTGVYGPRGTVIRPRTAKGLIIPVPGPPSGESYIESGGQFFVIRRFHKGHKPNPYDQRTAEKLQNEGPAIFDRALKDFAEGDQ